MPTTHIIQNHLFIQNQNLEQQPGPKVRDTKRTHNI